MWLERNIVKLLVAFLGTLFLVLAVNACNPSDEEPEIRKGKSSYSAPSTSTGGPWKKDIRGRSYSVSKHQDMNSARHAYFDCKNEYGVGRGSSLCADEEAEYEKYYG